MRCSHNKLSLVFIAFVHIYDVMISSYALSIHVQSTTTTGNGPALSKRKPLGKPPPEIWPEFVVGGKEDPAMGKIEENQFKAQRRYGDVLDAGTGIYSLRWLAGLLYRHSDPNDPLRMSSFVAVTADDNFRKECQTKAEELGISDWCQVVKGNWDIEEEKDDQQSDKYKLCEGQMFDTILADYLVGAVDHFSPFFQDKLFHRLSSHLKSGGIIHLTGLNPIPEKVDGPGNIFCRITKLRDACILLAGSRPYREHPNDWVVRHLENAGFEVIDVSKFPNVYNYKKIEVQINACRSTLKFINDLELRESMGKQIDKIDQECKEICDRCENGEFTLGYDWVISATKRC